MLPPRLHRTRTRPKTHANKPGVRLREVDIPGKSRGLVALTDISAGDVLILEQPECFIIGNTDACEHCGQWTWRSSDALRRALDGREDLIAQALFEAGITEPHPCAGAQCDRCSRRWCSSRCRLAGAASHAFLCAIGEDLCPLWAAPGHFRLFAVAIAKAISGALEATDANGHRKETEPASCFLECFCSPSSVRATLDIELGFLQQVAPSVAALRREFEERLATSHEPLERIAAVPLIQRWLTAEGYQRFHCMTRANGQEIHVPSPVTGLLARMLQAAPASAAVQACVRACLELNGTRTAAGGDLLRKLGGSGQALFKIHSKLNHSCTPNALVMQTGVDAGMIVRAAAPILAGDEVCICYLDLEPDGALESPSAKAKGVATVAARRQELLVRYGFWCSCERCFGDDLRIFLSDRQHAVSA